MKLKPEQELQAWTILKALPLFAGCPDVSIQAIAKLLDARDIPVGKVILMDQEIGKTLFILSAGSVGVYKRVAGEKKQLAVLKAPDFFGERSMFEESPASALVKSEERVLAYALERSQFDLVAAQFPGILEPIRKNMEEIRLKRIGPPKPAADPS
jgi:CRP/FNR family transcriptional regulator, cyclic AMP receptor protein